MDTIITIVCSIGMIWGLLYILYFYGYANYRRTRAVVFVGTISKRKQRAKIKVSSCDGFLKRALWLKKNSQYELTLASQSSAGKISVEILDSHQERVALLDSTCQSVCLNTNEARYYLVFHFEKATGELALSWRKI